MSLWLAFQQTKLQTVEWRDVYQPVAGKHSWPCSSSLRSIAYGGGGGGGW